MAVQQLLYFFILFFFFFQSIICDDTDSYDIYECPRIRKAWHLSSDEERQQWIRGFHIVNDQGKLKHFGLAHHHLVDQSQAHLTSEFFAWHRYFVWEFENQIRRISEDYKCFSMPYWDLTVDAGLFDEAVIFNSGLGGIGDVEHDDCVDLSDDAAWGRTQFPLEHICHESMSKNDNPSNGCCLKRAGGYTDLSAIPTYTNYITQKAHFGADDGFRAAVFDKFHNEAHDFAGGNFNNYTHMISRYSSEDPLFYMLHTWLDYVFVAWKQCHSYNQISSDDLDDHPLAYFAYPKESENIYIPSSQLDDKLYYVPMDDIEWFEKDKFGPTARKMWDEKDWNIQYERGTFIARSHLTQLCDGGWDNNIILKNSDETKEKIRAMRGDVDIMSEVEDYQHKVWQYIEGLMRKNKDDEDETFSRKDLLQTWDAKTCNYQRQRVGKEPCYQPLEYEKCTDEDYERRHQLTIDDLLSKEGVAGNDCLEEVRFNNYAWAKSIGKLYELCMGDFDDAFLCQAPKIDFVIEYDEDEYYQKLNANKHRMEREKEANDDDEEEELDAVIIGGIDVGNYPSFVVFRYLLIAFIFGGAAFMAMIAHCCNEYNTKLKPMDVDDDVECHRRVPSFRYGSVVEML